jgi:hypothetical protein
LALVCPYQGRTRGPIHWLYEDYHRNVVTQEWWFPPFKTLPQVSTPNERKVKKLKTETLREKNLQPLQAAGLYQGEETWEGSRPSE